ncbi:hypothetical protein GOODEAATRI_022182, partial [Goodea atripinnis]
DQMPDSTNAIYKAAAALWKPWLDTEALTTLSQGGFYSQLVKPGLRLVSLNTILYYGPDKVTSNMTDPAGQFEWLERILEKAAQSQEKVYIIAHVPVGYLPFVRNTTAIRERHNERLVAIFRKYSHVVTGQFYGNPVNSLFVSPAVTPIKSIFEQFSNNPSFRMYLYNNKNYSVKCQSEHKNCFWLSTDSKTFPFFLSLFVSPPFCRFSVPLKDIWQYYLNLTEANEKQRSDWRLEYIMTEAFGLTDLQPKSLLQLGLSFMLPHTKSFDKYFSHFMVSYDNRLICDGSCKVNQVCAVLHLDEQSYSKCAASSHW